MGTLPSKACALADEALPPSLDMASFIRAPERLQPSRTTRCSAHTTASADFPLRVTTSALQPHSGISPGTNALLHCAPAGFTPPEPWP
jgi:hypothetical protein